LVQQSAARQSIRAEGLYRLLAGRKSASGNDGLRAEVDGEELEQRIRQDGPFGVIVPAGHARDAKLERLADLWGYE
jgi:hypothetical protein